MAEICTDLAVLDINRPAPFASAEIATAWCHVQMFNAANYLQAKNLSEYANSKLNHVLDGLHVYAGFQDLVDRTLDLSRRSNVLFTPLLTIVNECAINIKHLFNNAEFRHLLQKDRQLAFLVLSRVIEKQERADSATEELKTRLFEISNEAENADGASQDTHSRPSSRQLAKLTTNGTHDSASNLDRLTRRTMELKLEFLELGEKHKQTCNSNRHLRSKLDQRDLDVEKAEKDNAALNDKLQAAQKACSINGANVLGLHGELRAKDKRVEELEKKVKSLETTLASRQAEVRKLNEALMKKSIRVQNEEFESKIKGLETALASKQAEVRRLNESLMKKSTRNQNEESGTKIKGLETALASKQAEVRKLNEAMMKKSARVQQLEAKVQAASKENVPTSPKKGLFTPLGLSGSRYATPSESGSISGTPYTPDSGVKIDQATFGAAPRAPPQSVTPLQVVTPIQNGVAHASQDVKAQLAKVTKERDILKKEREFLKERVSELRLGNTPARAPSDMSGSASKKKYDEALKFAAKDYKSCNDCGIPFNCEFRGAPEDPSVRHLALNCTKCGSEQMRWPV